jgi:hypothetical protein
MTMIVPESHLVQVSWKVLFGDSVELGKPFLGVAPEAFQAVNINLACCKSFSMVDSQVAIPAEHQGIVTPELIGVNYRTAPDHFNGLVKQAFGRDVLNHRHLHFSVSLEYTEDRNLTCRSPATLTFSTAAEIGFIEFDLAGGPEIAFSSQQGLPDKMTPPQDRRIAQANLCGHLVRGDIEFKELDDPQQLFQRYPALSNPSIREVMKGASAAFTAEFSAFQTIDFIAVTNAAENMAIFPAEFPEEQSGPVFCFPYEFKGFELTKAHMHKIILVQDAL